MQQTFATRLNKTKSISGMLSHNLELIGTILSVLFGTLRGTPRVMTESVATEDTVPLIQVRDERA